MNKKMLSLFLSMIFMITSLSTAALSESNHVKISNQIETSSHIIIHVDDGASVASILISDGFDVLYGTITNTSFELIVTPDDLIKLKKRGFNPAILSHGRPFLEIQNYVYSVFRAGRCVHDIDCCGLYRSGIDLRFQDEGYPGVQHYHEFCDFSPHLLRF